MIDTDRRRVIVVEKVMTTCTSYVERSFETGVKIGKEQRHIARAALDSDRPRRPAW
jgi:hypothetical protein